MTLRTDVDPRSGRTVQLIGRSRNDGQGTGNLAAVFLGTSSAEAPLFGPSHCRLRVDLAQPFLAQLLPVDVDGNFTSAVPLPNNPTLVGAEFVLQALVAPSPSPVGLDFSEAILWRVGS